MSDATDLSRIAAARRDIAAVEERLPRLTVALADARATVAGLEGRGAAGAPLEAARRRLERAEREHAAAAGRAEGLRDRLTEISGRIVARRSPEELIATLAADRPFVLLPVRLETRFTADRSALRVRIFPDQVHLDQHDPELAEAEAEAARAYWTERASSAGAGGGGGAERATAAWRDISRRLGPGRAAFAVRAVEPRNVAEVTASGTAPDFPEVTVKPVPWMRPVRARALPDRFVIVGFRGSVERGWTEVCRVWGASVADTLPTTPTPHPTGEEPAGDPALPPVDDGMRWVVEYGAAERAGMAITVRNADLRAGSLADGLDLLVCLGADWTRTPEESSNELAELLDHHRWSDGAGLMAVGTATNNAADGRAGAASAADADLALDPAAVPPPVGPRSGARLLASALGLSNGATTALDELPGAWRTEDETARHMNNALWEATLGYYLDQFLEPLLDDDRIDTVRQWFSSYVRGRGPLPVLRLGRQPYGVLPVVASRRWRPVRGGRLDEDLHRLLGHARPLLRSRIGAVPRMGATSDPAADLWRILQQTPRAAQTRWRRALGPLLVSGVAGLERLAANQESLAAIVGWVLGWRAQPRIARTTMEDRHHRLRVPWTQAEPLSDDPGTAPGYLAAIAADLAAPNGAHRLAAREDAAALLEALLAHAARLELGRAGQRVVKLADLIAAEHLTIESATLRHAVEREPEMPGVTGAAAGSPSGATPFLPAISGAVAAKITGTASVGEWISTELANPGPQASVILRGLPGFQASLAHLAGASSADLDRAFRESLDLVSHRFDAWATSLAVRRLEEIRGRAAGGAHLGAVGWVEGLRPDRTPDSLGYVHAPSLAQAATAAVLRSGHLAHLDGTRSILDLDLSSARVREGLAIIDGVRQGQPLGALLGYRFERGLRETLVLARYILPIRRLAPLRTEALPEDGLAVESIAARDVVDGVRLLERWRRSADDFFARLHALRPLAGGDRGRLEDHLDRLASLYDAAADILVAEAVHQTVQGNPTRSGAALGSLDRQEMPPEPEVIRTPRTGRSAAVRLVVALQDTTVDPAWAGLPADARAVAEPRANAWLSRVLPSPARLRFAGEALDEADAVVETVEITAADLGLSPLSLVVASGAPAGGDADELRARVAAALAARVTAPGIRSLRLLDGRADGWPADAVEPRALVAVLRRLRDLLASSRPLAEGDLSVPGADPQAEDASAWDVAELRARADAVVAAAESARSALAQAIAGGVTGQLLVALEAASAAGVPAAFPTSDDEGTVLAQAQAVETALAAALETAGGTAAAATSPPGLQVDAERHRIRAVLGEAMPVVPMLTVGAAAREGIAASLADRPAVLGGDDGAATTWLERSAAVRPDVARLAYALTAAELLGAPASARELEVVQLPHIPGARWFALPSADGSLPAIAASVVVHAARGLRPSAPLAGVVVDAWQEVVPNATETTGASFQYDAPGARAPQSILLAVPPDPRAAGWSFDDLTATVHEVVELMRLRAVDPQEIPVLARFLPATYLPANYSRATSSVFLEQIRTKVSATSLVLGKEL